MKSKSTKKKRKRLKKNKSRNNLNLPQERASYFFFIGLLIISIFGCVASGAPRQAFYGILFMSTGILVALFPPAFKTAKWLNISLVLFLISLSTSLLPRNFAGNQNWRIKLESLGLETGKLISPHPTATIESLIIVGLIIIIGLCSLGHRISRGHFLKIASIFVLAISVYTAVSMIIYQNKWDWVWDPNDQFGFFANRNHMATLMVMASLIGVGTLFLHLNKRNWIAILVTLSALSIICWAILGYSVSRSGLFLFISFQVLWFALIGKKHLNYKLVTSFLVLLCLSLILFFLSDTVLEDRLGKLLPEKEISSKFINNDAKNEYDSILGLRKYIHSDTYKMIQSEPWTGTGLGTYEYIFPIYKNDSVSFKPLITNSNVLHPESNWLDLASQAGISSVILALICIIPLLILTLLKNRTSRSWLLCLACVLSIFCILIHGIIDVPGQKIGIIMSGILLIGITSKPNLSKDESSHRCGTFIFQIFAIGYFSLGLLLIHSQWFNSTSIFFSDPETRMNKIQKLYQLSISASLDKDINIQKNYIKSAIDLTENAIKKSPLDPDLHFIRGKLYSFIDGEEEETKSSFKIESALDPNWGNLPLRQSLVWLFIDTKETRRLWTEALKRSSISNFDDSKMTWEKILNQAKQHPIQIRDVYKIILDKNDPYYVIRWMGVAGNNNLNIQTPKILGSNLLSDSTKKEISDYWRKLSPLEYKKFTHDSNN